MRSRQADSGSQYLADLAKQRRYRLVQVDSAFVGVVTVGSTFLPVFLARLGATAPEIGLLTAIPAVVAFLFAIPMGRWLQERRHIVRWYSRLRLAGWSGYAVIALLAALIPSRSVTAILVTWALASLPSVAGLVAFPIVMDAAAGADGRFDLLGRRWAISGVVTSLSAVLAGGALVVLPFPGNFEALFLVIAGAGLASSLVSSRIVLPDDTHLPAAHSNPARWLLPPVRSIGRNRSFVWFELRSLVYTSATGIAMPILPLFYVHELGAPNSWIGLIGAAQAGGAVLGYLVARRLSRRGAIGILLPALLGTALVPITVSTLDWLPAVAFAIFVGGISTAGAQLALFDELMRRIPHELGVTFSSVDQSVQNFGLILGPTVGGILVPVIGLRHGLLIAGLTLAVALTLFSIDARAGRRSARGR